MDTCANRTYGDEGDASSAKGETISASGGYDHPGTSGPCGPEHGDCSHAYAKPQTNNGNTLEGHDNGPGPDLGHVTLRHDDENSMAFL